MLFFLASCLSSADTLSDIMAAHRKVLGKLNLSAQTRTKVTALDDAFESATRAYLQELVALPRTSPRRRALVAKMKKANQDHRAALAQALGTKWPAYQRAYAAAVPSSRRNASAPAGASKKKSGSRRPARKTTKGS